MTITEHIAAVRREMAEAARESGRSERDIFLVGASKMNDAQACRDAIAAAVTNQKVQHFLLDHAALTSVVEKE